MRCILHIGTEKTATTLLQDWLYANQTQLAAQRVYLSDNLEKTNNRLFPAYFNSELDDWARQAGIRSLEGKARHFAGFEARLAEEIRTASRDHDVFIITSEHLHSRIEQQGDIIRIRDFLHRHFAQVQVLCYFRNQAEMAVSLYSTALKLHSTSTLDTFLARDVTPARYYYNFEQIAQNWAGAFGTENCRFRLYDRARFHGGDIRLDFLALAGIALDISRLDFSHASSNESLPALRGAAFRQINRFIPYWNESTGTIDRLNVRLKKALAALPSLKAGKFCAMREPEIFAAFTESNERFVQKFLPGEQGFTPPAPPSEPQHFTQAEVEQIIGELSGALLENLGNDRGARLHDEDADALRDMALRIEQGKRLALSDALVLMALARRARPKGPFISRKLEEYRQALARPRRKPWYRWFG